MSSPRGFRPTRPLQRVMRLKLGFFPHPQLTDRPARMPTIVVDCRIPRRAFKPDPQQINECEAHEPETCPTALTTLKLQGADTPARVKSA